MIPKKEGKMHKKRIIRPLTLGLAALSFIACTPDTPSATKTKSEAPKTKQESLIMYSGRSLWSL